jgi:16S rRNA (adenine1518-N6/adenine1519-N6)-dimethyltransferase
LRLAQLTTTMTAMADRAFAHRPAKRRFGQHFLEAPWAAKLLGVIAPAPDDTFIEIGPGRGAITRLLAASTHRVLAYEIDRDFAAAWHDEALSGLHVVQADFLDVTTARVASDLAAMEPELPPGGRPKTTLRVVGNLPYNVASPILFKLVALFMEGLPIQDATVMLQREVADRLLAEPETKDYGVLTVLIRHRATVERLLQLPPGAFRPAPRVRSSVVRLRFHAPEPPAVDPVVFTQLVQAIFTRRRKTIANAILAYPAAASGALGGALEVAGIDPRRRPETLSISELVRLADTVAERKPH